MFRPAAPLLFAAALAAVAPAAAADVLELRGGQAVTGEVLKEDGDALYVDLGVEVVRIPKDRVLTRSEVDAAAAAVAGVGRPGHLQDRRTCPAGASSSSRTSSGRGSC